jgi:hypothetical protein
VSKRKRLDKTEKDVQELREYASDSKSVKQTEGGDRVEPKKNDMIARHPG